MAGTEDAQALARVRSLVGYLAEVTDAAERDPIRDLLSSDYGAPEVVSWLTELPSGVRFDPLSADDVILRIKPPQRRAEPRLPDRLRGWTDSDELRGSTKREPQLLVAGPLTAEPDQRSGPPKAVLDAFESWFRAWRGWAAEHDRQQSVLALYAQLERAAKIMEQQDDAYEFVLGVGLVVWQTPSGESVRRHLVTEAVTARIDRTTAEVTVALGAGRRRFEDKEVFGGEEAYQPERARSQRQAVLDADATVLDPIVLELLGEWLTVGLTVACEYRREGPTDTSPSSTLTLMPAPALVLRPRSRVLLAEAYRRIATALRDPSATVPVGLAQLVVDTERHQRDAWLHAQGADPGDVLGEDPLFPLATNDEQHRVIDLLRTETGVVVQGPPGTGKTHTIANLVSALLARGQRVLVTSQKDQALKVLRDKIPPELRRLCVLLAGGSKDAAQELEQGLDALSEAQASAAIATLPGQIKQLATERAALRSTAAALNSKIRELREVETVQHPAVVPGYSRSEYAGPLTEIVRQVKAKAERYDWIPVVDTGQPDGPPLGVDDLRTLLRLLRDASPNRAARTAQRIPLPGELPDAGAFADAVTAEREAERTARTGIGPFVQKLVSVGEQRLTTLVGMREQVQVLLQRLGIDRTGTPEWVRRALDDRLAERNEGLWGHLATVRGEPARLQARLQEQGVSYVIDVPSVAKIGLGRAKGLLDSGRQLLDYLEHGGRLRKMMKSSVEKQATELLNTVRVDGRSPAEPAQLSAALELLEAEIAAALLIFKWADARVVVTRGSVAQTLSQLVDNERILIDIDSVAEARDRAAAVLADGGRALDLSTLDAFLSVLDDVPGALRHLALERARIKIDRLAADLYRLAADGASCPETARLREAVEDRDVVAYRAGMMAIEKARNEQADQHRCDALQRTLRGIHPQLADLIAGTAADPVWDTRLRDLPAAWAWSKAVQFVARWRNAEEERRLVVEFDQVEDKVRRLTEQFAAAEALRACMARMTDTHARALRSYREHMSHVGAGGGRKAAQFRKAARAAMEKAKDAVPAWVVPLPNLLDNIPADRDSFDVVIVDEASQVGLENLFLLWMAPRVIVVGDDKQCTPGASRMGRLDDLFASLDEHLAEIDHEIRQHFTSKSNLYGLLSARSGRDAVIRLREHFRCVPEIINWSSRQFYGEEGLPGLVALRERKATDLKPLVVVHVEGGYTEGRQQRKRNPVEAKRLVAQLIECLGDPRYAGKTFGVIVLQGQEQVKLLDREIAAATTPEQREDHRIRVGTPPNFQGDERDVIFLSMVVAEPPNLQAALTWQQSYNVAASRAKDQMWLFASVRMADLKPGDLRASLMSYMMAPPSVFGPSPGLAAVSATQPCEPFDSLFEQRVFRDIKERGYYAVPQYHVGSRRLDIVVVGEGGRLAVECDGHYWHSSNSAQISDARRDRDLRRMGWEVIRIRESEYEFAPERELAPLWERLAERGIRPSDVRQVRSKTSEWVPVDLVDDPTQEEPEAVG